MGELRCVAIGSGIKTLHVISELYRRKIRPNSDQMAPLGEEGCKQESSLQGMLYRSTGNNSHNTVSQPSIHSQISAHVKV